MSKIALLLSGGVDSSVALHMLCQDGEKPDCYYIHIGPDKDDTYSCTSDEDVEMCQAVTKRYGVKFEIIDLHKEYWDEVVKYIVEMCDEAMKTLPDAIVDPNIDYGHATKPAAAMLKAEALVWLASPLFNGNNDYADVVDNRGTRLFPTADPTRWAAAAKACKEAIDICEQAGIKLYEFTDMRYDLSETTKRLMDIRGAVTDPWNVETIYSHPRWPSNDAQHFTKPRLINAELTGGGSDNGAYSATFKMAELFYSHHGVPIEEDTEYTMHE